MSLIFQLLQKSSKKVKLHYNYLKIHFDWSIKIIYSTKYRKDIQVLRGVAVVAVVLFHAEENYFPLGYLGVDVFFVISGFVVTPLILRIFNQESILERLSNLKYFYTRRFYRLAPALAATLIPYSVAIFLTSNVQDFERFARQGIATLFLIGNFGAYHYSGDYFSHVPNPLIHTWSLSVEEQIYIFLPVFLLLIFYRRANIKDLVILVFSLVTIISFTIFLFPLISQPIYSYIIIQDASEFSFYSPISRVWQFTLGSLTSILLNRYSDKVSRISKPVKIALVIGLFSILFLPTSSSMQKLSIFATFCAVFVLTYGSLDLLPSTLGNKFEWLGYRSYPIYLVHLPLLFIFKYSAATVAIIANQNIRTIIAVIVSILTGSLLHAKIEKRFRDVNKVGINQIKTNIIALLLTFIIPLSLFITLYIGSKNTFWGLDRNIPKPAYAGNITPECFRFSELKPPCEYNQVDSTKKVLLIGDSHAVHISQAVISAARNKKWNVQVWSYCRVQFKRSTDDYVTDACLKNNRHLLDWIIKDKPDLVIVSQFVHRYNNLANFKSALNQIQKESQDVLLISNNPVFPDNKDFFISKPILGPQYSPPRQFPDIMMNIEDKATSAKLAIWAQNNKILTLDFTPLFCKKNICTRYLNGKWLYFDADHFSIDGASLTVPLIEKILSRDLTP